MRVITGTARGRRLQTLEGNDVRPTTDKVKEAVFSSIQFDIEDRRVLDLFAGSGQLGIEALSRGASHATFIDLNPDAINVIKANVKATDFEDKSTIRRSDCFSFLASTNEEFDIVFLDPPYREGLLQKTLAAATNIVSDYGIIICERPTDIELPVSIDGFVEKKQLKFGKILVSIFRKESV